MLLSLKGVSQLRYPRGPQRLPEQYWLTGVDMALISVIGVLSKSLHPCHSSAWKPSFQLPLPSFLSLKRLSGHQGPLGPAMWQARSATEWMFLRSRPPTMNDGIWCIYTPFPCSSGEMTLRGVFLNRLHPSCPCGNLFDNILYWLLSILCLTSLFYQSILGLPPT